MKENCIESLRYFKAALKFKDQYLNEGAESWFVLSTFRMLGGFSQWAVSIHAALVDSGSRQELCLLFAGPESAQASILRAGEQVTGGDYSLWRTQGHSCVF